MLIGVFLVVLNYTARTADIYVYKNISIKPIDNILTEIGAADNNKMVTWKTYILVLR